MSNISVGGGIYNLSVPLKNAITTLKQRQEQASDALALQGFSGTDAKTQAMIAELSAQITALEKQLAMVNQNIRKVLAMEENGASSDKIELKDGLFASFAQQNGEQCSQELGSLLKASAQNVANTKVAGDDMRNTGDEVSAGMSFDSGVNELAGLVELDPSKLPEGDTKQQKLAKLTAMKTAIEEKIVALQSKIADLMAPSLNVLA